MYSVVNIPSQIVHKVFTIVTQTAFKTKNSYQYFTYIGFCITPNKTCHIWGFSIQNPD